jgi:hypothetical protein
MKKTSILILLALLAFGPKAWAQGYDYITADGTPHNTYTDGINNVYVLDGIIAADPNSDISLGYTGADNWFVVQGSNVVLNGQLGYKGDLNLILCDGAKLIVNKTDGNAIQSLDNTDTKYTLTIYVQTNGTGQLVATASGDKAIQTENLTIHGGVISATGGANGIYAPNSNIIINGGTVTAVADGNAIEGFNVTINGGIVSATGNGGIKNGLGGGRTTLGYTNSSDQITATSYLLGNIASSVYIKDDQYMITDNGVIVYGWLNEDKRNAIAGHTLSPYVPTEWDGNGESDDPYIIASVDDLNLLSLRTNGGSNDYSDKYYKLGNNITFTASSDWNDASSTESNFTAIGSFSGHFDGDVYTISGLRIRKDDGVGLFGYLAEGAVVENITLSNSRVTGNSQIGGIVGSLQPGATVNNCHVTNTVYVYSKYHYTGIRGGVVGYNNGGTISNCISEATIGRTTEVWDNTDDKAGGIVGVNDSGTLTGNLVIGANITCYTENYGAIAGNSSGTLTNNYYRACTINGTANATSVGCNSADVTTGDGALSLHTIAKPNDVNNGTSATLTYNNTRYWAQGKSITLSDGLDSQPEPGYQKAYYINGVALQENSTTISHTFDMPATDVTISIGEIHADWAIANAGTQADPYKIYFTDQLSLLATRVNDGTSTYSGEYFQLMDDLTYDNTEQNNYIAIGTSSHPFKGHFNGNQKTIYGIRIYGTGSYQGAFGYIVDAEVKDLYVNDIMISGHDRVGCIVGECDGSTTITNCRVTTATLTATGDSSAQQLFGGIAGHNSGTSTMSNNFVLGATISYVYHFGAIAGENGGSLVSNYYHNCFKDGTAFPTGIGCNGGDVGGAEPVFTVSVPDGVTAAATATVTHNTVNYYKEGVTVTLSGGLDGTPAVGRQYAYVVYGETLIGSNLAPGHEFDMQNANAVVTIGSMPADWAVANEGTQADPYKIYFTDQLDLLATRVNAGESYSGKYFKLMDDLTYDNTQQNNYIAIGTSTHPFSGHFNGNQKTINGVRINSTGGYLGVFGYINNAEVKDLYVNDIEITAHDRVGSIVGECDGSTAISGCRVTTATLNVAGDATYQQLFGGIAGHKSGSTSTMSNNFVLGLTIPQVYHFGAIAGENSTGAQSMVSNHYHNCTVGSTAYPTGVGCNGQDVEGAKAVFTLTLADGISTNATLAVVYNTVDYYENGATINLSYVTPANPGYRHIYSVNSESIEGDSFVLNANATVTVAPNRLINWETEYAGTEADPYLISNVEQWDILASNVSISGITYSGKFFKLMEDISITEMVGGGDGSSNIFSGTFDGNGHTITFNAENATEQYIAPFRRIDGATIMGVKLEGTVSSSNRFAGGIVAYAKGTSTVTNCINSTNISTVNYNLTDSPSNGGIVGMVGGNGTINISGCVFNGQMHGTQNNNWCGILGLCNKGCTANISNCLVDPVSAVEHGNTIYRSSGTTNCSNCYYTNTIGNAQGKQAYSITGANEYISIEIDGIASSETTIGVIGYNPGIKYDGVHYAASGETVSLLLDYTEPGYAVNYYANGTLLTLNDFNSYTLTMPNADVVITADVTLTTIYREIAGYGDGTDKWAFIASPVSGSIGVNDVEHLMGNTISTNPIVYDFDLYRLNPSDMMWENYHAHTSDFNIVNGMGYLYATKETKTLEFTGKFNMGTSEELTGLPAGFNLVGNPFTVDAYVSKPYYKMNNDGSAILADVQSIATPIPPCYGVIVEVGESETVTFNTSGVFSAGPNNGGLTIALVQANTRSNAVMDNAIVSFNEGERLGKFYFGTQSANIYIPQNGKDYAIAYSKGQGEMPLNFKANENGQYTITMHSKGVEMAYLHLIDNMTGNDVDLLAPNGGDAIHRVSTYTFEAKTTDYESRFRLVFACGDTGDNDAPFAYLSNGEIVITGVADTSDVSLQVIDMQGRVLVCRDAQRASTISTTGMVPGVYVLRLIDGNNVRTQKMVIQ